MPKEEGNCGRAKDSSASRMNESQYAFLRFLKVRNLSERINFSVGEGWLGGWY